MGATKWRKKGTLGEFVGGIQLDAHSEIINPIRWKSHHLFFP